jgi:signal transduction histidine kinase
VAANIAPESATPWARDLGLGETVFAPIAGTESYRSGVVAAYWVEKPADVSSELLEDISTTVAYVFRAEAAAVELAEINRSLIVQDRLATLGKLTATVSHELRNPLGTIRASFYTIERALAGSTPEKVERALERASRSIFRCDRIIEELLSFTRETHLDLESTPLDDWLRDELQAYAFPEDIDVSLDLQESIEIAIDRQAIYQCLVNLLNNACDALGERETGPKTLSVSLQRRDDHALVAVEDSGPGIPEADRARVFDPLFSTKGFGTGLGLALVRKLCRLHGGDVTLENRAAGGARATLLLPLD